VSLSTLANARYGNMKFTAPQPARHIVEICSRSAHQ
jgi:hypothetical protein